MTFSLHVESRRWREHLAHVHASVPTLIPVIKGNGYGFGPQLLAEESDRLGVTTVAVGTADEVASVHNNFRGDVLVLMPWHPLTDPPTPADERLVLTVAHPEAVRALVGHRQPIVVELLTSMCRFGLDVDDVDASAVALRQLNVVGWALHLPLDAEDGSRVAEVGSWVARLRHVGLDVQRLWVSHLTDAELAQVRAAQPDVAVLPRVGTRLWLGDRGSYQARGSVLATHRVQRGERLGYRQRPSSADGTVLVVSGGTSHGVALSAPRAVSGVVTRAKAAAHGGLEVLGRTLSPFAVSGKKRWFVEPPHMQVSMVWLPADVDAPQVGDEVDAEMRMTTALFDHVVLH